MLGAPGVGKGTQAKQISVEYSIPHISTGDMLREEVKNKTQLAEKAKTYMDKGELVPDHLIIEMLLNRVQKDQTDSFILDGFPRTLPQAEALDESLNKLDLPIDMVVEISLDNEEIIKRISNRRLCKSCGADYNLLNNPPENGSCRKCGQPVIQRDDDKEATVRNRLDVYDRQTKPVSDFYGKLGLLQKVNGAQSAEDVFGSITMILQNVHIEG